VPSDKPARRLEDIIENAQAIQPYVAGLDLAAFEKDQKTYDAVERCLERISEAAAKLGDLAPSLVPGQPWQEIRALGNRLRHEYDAIREDRLWDIDDRAGNQTQVNPYTVAYDGEEHATDLTNAQGTSLSYRYDAEGRRVKKVYGSLTTLYVYDGLEQLAAEYSTQAAVNPCGTATCYLTVDHLGSTRLLTDSAGNAMRRYDYEPFGTEILAGVGGRTTAMGFAGTQDSFNLKYTGQERDSETGLDYLHARYYSAAQGRFQSPDAGNTGADPSDPQTWNGYAYVNNNPLMYTDPDGEGLFGAIFGFLGGAFGGPWGAIAASAVGNGIDAVIWGPGAAGIPGTPLNLGSLIGGGGLGGPGRVYGGGSTGGVIFSVINVQGLPGVPTGYGIYNWDFARTYLLQAGVIASTIRKLEASRTVYTVKINKNGKNDYNPNTHVIRWDPRNAAGCNTGGTMSPALRLGHELSHAAGPGRPGVPEGPPYDDSEERRVITGPERAAAQALGECVRTEHDFPSNFLS
jgi:RHS repeat-associated protein